MPLFILSRKQKLSQSTLPGFSHWSHEPELSKKDTPKVEADNPAFVQISVDDWFFNLSEQRNPLENLFSHRLLGPIHRVSDSVDLGRDLKFAFLTSFQQLMMLFWDEL